MLKELIRKEAHYVPFRPLAAYKDPYLVFMVLLILKLTVFNGLLGYSALRAPDMWLSVSGVTLISFSVVFLFRNRVKAALFFTMNVVVTILLLANLLHFRQFQAPLSIFTLLQSDNLHNLSESILSLLRPGDALFTLDLLLIILMHVRKKKPVLGQVSIGKFLAVLLTGAILLSSFISYQLFWGSSIKSISTINYDRAKSLAYMTPFGYSASDVLFYFKYHRRTVLTDSQRASIDDWFKSLNHFRESDTQATDLSRRLEAFGKGKNLVMIQFESLETFVINLVLDGVEITPNLNRLLNQSVYYPNIYPQTMAGRSSDAELLTNLSLFPLKEGSVFFRYPDNEYVGLAHLLKNQGYASFALHGDYGSYWNRAEAYPGLGFDDYYRLGNGLELDERVGMGLSDGSFYRQAVEIMKSKPEPYYALMITLSSHTPFRIPDRVKTLRLDDWNDAGILKEYLQSVHYADEQLGKLISSLEQSGLRRNSILAIYGDHEAIPLLNREAIVGKKNAPPWFKLDGTIPFILSHPDMTPATIPGIGGQVDILPTLLHVMGVRDPEAAARFGRNLFTAKSEYAVLPLHQQLLVSPSGAGSWLTEHYTSALDFSDLLIRSNYFVPKK